NAEAADSCGHSSLRGRTSHKPPRISAFDPKQTLAVGHTGDATTLLHERTELPAGWHPGNPKLGRALAPVSRPLRGPHVLCPASQGAGIQYRKSASVERKLTVQRVFGSQCPQGGADIIAPEWSEHVSAHCSKHVVLRHLQPSI